MERKIGLFLQEQQGWKCFHVLSGHFDSYPFKLIHVILREIWRRATIVLLFR
jgi:hypothetical protein